MKTSLAIVTALLIGASATGASALGGTIVAPLFGSDTLYNVTNGAVAYLGLTPGTAYVAGGSGTGQNAMLANTQFTAPMSKMLTSGACSYNGSAGSGDGNASGIVVGMDAVDILAASSVIDPVACSGTSTSGDGAGNGLAYSGTTAFSTNVGQNWKWVLALVYGGKDYSQAGAPVDCNQQSRKNLVNNWSNLFQNSGSCSNGNATCQALAQYGDGTHTPLWHAFRRDEASGTSDVFSSLLGLSPSTSQTANNGFGASPYCNALNWDSSALNASCALSNHDQFTGPGGIIDPLSQCPIGATSLSACGAAGTGNHRMPPLVAASWNANNNVTPPTTGGGVWGLNPNVTKLACNGQTADPTQCIYDVLPTDMQDNDPIRRPCQGNTTNNAAFAGEEVCNLDNALGLVLAIPASDFIGRAPPTGLGQEQYPTNKCNTFYTGNAANIFTCAISSPPLKHSGECPNGDSLFGGQCLVPADSTTANNAQCVSKPGTVAQIRVRSNLGVAGGYKAGNPDGRVYNLQMYNQGTNGKVAYTQQVVQNVVSGVPLPISRDFVGGVGRIHQVQTQTADGVSVGCQMLDATDQIGCLVQADPCSIGYAGDGGKSWNLRPDGTNTAPAVSGTDSARMDQVYPTATTVNLLGEPGEYVMARKLYFNSIEGFAAVATSADPDELQIGELESSYSIPAVSAAPAPGGELALLLQNDGYFQVQNGPKGNSPFCEDFNEGIVCTTSSVTVNNAQNACTTNVGLTTATLGTIPSEPVSATSLSAPTQSTVCGNGKLEAYEECDNGSANGTSGNTCSTTCRCAGINKFYGPNNCAP